MNKNATKWVSLAAVVTIVAVTGWGLSGRAQNRASADSARGAVLYAENCALCHGANLEGQPDWQTPGVDEVLPAPPHDRTGHTWHHGDKLLFDYTKLGGDQTLKQMGVADVKSGMPGFGGTLSDQEIWDILAFIKESWPDRERKLQEQRTEAEQTEGN